MQTRDGIELIVNYDESEVISSIVIGGHVYVVCGRWDQCVNICRSWTSYAHDQSTPIDYGLAAEINNKVRNIVRKKRDGSLFD